MFMHGQLILTADFIPTMLNMLTVVLISLIVLLFVQWIWKRSRHMSLLSRYQIPGDKPHFLLGNLMDNAEDHRTHAKWFEKYGKVVGFYNGYVPTVLVKDVDFLKQ